jgi:hypothetical protein
MMPVQLMLIGLELQSNLTNHDKKTPAPGSIPRQELFYLNQEYLFKLIFL